MQHNAAVARALSSIAIKRSHCLFDDGPCPSFFILQNCDSYEARLKTLGRSTSGEDESSKRQSQYADSDVAPEELDSVSQSKLKQSSDGIINCQGGTVPPGEARRPSKIDIPCVVSIEQEEDRKPFNGTMRSLQKSNVAF